MIQLPVNTKLIDTLAQVILALSQDERKLLDQRLGRQPVDLNDFFSDLTMMPPDPNQPSLEEISQTVHEVRQELWG